MGDSFSILFDTIVVDKENIETKIAISAAIAQNTKLMQCESEVTQSIEESSSIPKTLAKSGKINLSKKQVAQKIGELFIVKNKINLHYDLLDTPEFFGIILNMRVIMKSFQNILKSNQGLMY